MIKQFRSADEEADHCFICDSPVPQGIAYTGDWVTMSFVSFGLTLCQDFCSWECAAEALKDYQTVEDWMRKRR